MITPLRSAEAFRTLRDSAWVANAGLWLQHRRVNPAVKKVVQAWMRRTITHCSTTPHFLDVGCGNAWVLEILEAISGASRYTGLDVTDAFVDAGNQRQARSCNSTFVRCDIEREFVVLEQPVTAVLACLSLCEIPCLGSAFHNLARIVSKGVPLLSITLNPVVQALRSANSSSEILDALRNARTWDLPLVVSKPIRMGHLSSTEEYVTILHQIGNLIAAGRPWFRVRNVTTAGWVSRKNAIAPLFEVVEYERTQSPA